MPGAWPGPAAAAAGPARPARKRKYINVRRCSTDPGAAELWWRCVHGKCRTSTYLIYQPVSSQSFCNLTQFTGADIIGFCCNLERFNKSFWYNTEYRVELVRNGETFSILTALDSTGTYTYSVDPLKVATRVQNADGSSTMTAVATESPWGLPYGNFLPHITKNCVPAFKSLIFADANYQCKFGSANQCSLTPSSS